jgi:hypothetical protein
MALQSINRTDKPPYRDMYSSDCLIRTAKKISTFPPESLTLKCWQLVVWDPVSIVQIRILFLSAVDTLVWLAFTC